MNACRQNLSLDDFAGCLLPVFAAERSSAIDGRLDWLAPTPTDQIWSGVRELPYSITPDFEFLRAAGDPLSPFTFMVQVAIDSPAFFVEGAEPWYAEDNAAVDEYVDPDEPWEFTELSPTLNQTIANGIAASQERTSVFDDMREFALLQRFFRVALDGRLGPGFPMDELLNIDEATASAVDRSNPTLRWNVRPGLIEQSFYGEIEVDLADPGAAACRALIEEADASGGGFAIAAIDQNTWESVCGAAAFADSDTSTRAEQISAIRELRESLGVRNDDALVVSEAECPAP